MHQFEGFTIDSAKNELRRGDEPVRLTAKAFALLLYLIEHRDRTISKEELFKEVWGGGSLWNDSTRNRVDQALSDIRTALTEDTKAPRYIQAVPGVGVRFIATPIKEDPPLTPGTGRQQHGFPFRLIALIGTSLALVALVVYVLYRRRDPQKAPVPKGAIAVTHTNRAKFSPIVSDAGGHLFFTESENGRYWVSRVPNDGGEAVTVGTEVFNPHVAAISPDRKALLLRSIVNADFSDYDPLFIQPLDGSHATALGVTAFDGTWTPNGKSILYSRGQEIGEVDLQTMKISPFLKVDGDAWNLRFSPDGRRIRFTISDLKSQQLSLWEVTSDGKGLHRMFPESALWSNGGCGAWSPDGTHFLFHANGKGSVNLWWLDENASTPFRLTQGPVSYRCPISSSDGKTIFARGVLPRAELAQFNARTGEQTTFLPGISAEMISFSSDNKRIVIYETYPEYGLLLGSVDGKDFRPLVQRPIQSAFPQWSPDDRNILVSTRRAGEPWRVSLVTVADAHLEELTDTSVNAIHPSWSPDGKRVVFGNIPSVDSARMPIQLYFLDIASKTTRPIPGSQWLFSPSWSPDGKHIVAVHASANNLLLYDTDTQTWRTLTMAQAGYPVWSRNSFFVYFVHTSPDAPPSFSRVDIRNNRVETLFRIEGVKLLPRWIGIHPNGSLLAARDTSVQEIYALEF